MSYMCNILTRCTEDGGNFSMLSISIGGCGKFTDLSVRRMSNCPKLKEVILAWNKEITDLEVSHLQRHKYLGSIYNDVKITDLKIDTDAGLKV